MKSATTLKQQLDILKTRKLLIESDDEVLEFLKRNNYYRFSGYAKCFCVAPDCYDYKVSFKDIWLAYNFDSSIRCLLYKYVGKIEIYYKTLFAYHLSNKYGPLFYKDRRFYSCGAKPFQKFINKIFEDKQNIGKHELFAKHFDKDIPIWALVELISFGTISRFYSIIKEEYFCELCSSLKRLDYIRVIKGLKSITLIRNICSHHGRLFNKGFTNAPKLSNKTAKILKCANNPECNNRSLFIYCCNMIELLNNFKDGNDFIEELDNLFIIAPSSISISKNYGFISNWKEVMQKINDDNR